MVADFALFNLCVFVSFVFNFSIPNLFIMSNSFFYKYLNASQKRLLWIFFILIFGWIIYRALVVDMYTSVKARDSIHGDAYSDVNTHSAIKYFADFGFSKSSYLPVHQYLGDKNEANIKVYTHYPALPDILAGFYAYITGTTDEATLRIFPVILSVGFFFLIFQVLWKLTGSIQEALLAGLLVAGSNYFMFWADNLHKHLYEELFKWIFLFCLYQYYSGGKNKLLFFIAWIFFVANTNISFEPVTYLAVLTVGLSWIFERKIISFETVLMATAPFVGFGLHLWQNVDHFGSLDLALKDLTSAANMRATGEGENELKRSLNWTDYVKIPYMWSYRIERFFLIPGIALAVFGYFAWKKWTLKKNTRLKELLIVFIIATLSWNFAMTQHSVVHAFTTKHAGLLFALIAGTGVLAYREKLLADWKRGIWYPKVLHVIFCGYIIVMALSQQVWDLVRYGVAWPVLGR